MISLDLSFNILTKDLSHYLENQVKVGLFGSGVGLSLVLGFSAAYTCYYLISVAKVSECKLTMRDSFQRDRISLSSLYVNLNMERVLVITDSLKCHA